MRKSYFRNMIFGAEDSLVSTVGVLFGIATANYDKRLMLLTGLVVIAVEALSMGAGAFLSETSADEMEEGEGEDSKIVDGIIMFSSYFFAGFIPLTPYLLFSENVAKATSIAFSIVALFFLGFIPKKSIKAGLRMATIAGFAIFLGFLIANFVGQV